MAFQAICARRCKRALDRRHSRRMERGTIREGQRRRSEGLYWRGPWQSPFSPDNSIKTRIFFADFWPRVLDWHEFERAFPIRIQTNRRSTPKQFPHRIADPRIAERSRSRRRCRLREVKPNSSPPFKDAESSAPRRTGERALDPGTSPSRRPRSHRVRSASPNGSTGSLFTAASFSIGRRARIRHAGWIRWQ